jgi:hypothetical protein
MAAAAAQSHLLGFAIYALPDAVVVGVAVFRYWRNGATRSSSNERGSPSFRSLGSLALPLASGAVLGWTLKVQALLILGLVVCGFALLPWQRLSFHSRYLKTSLCLVAAGIGLVWLPFARPTPPVILAAMGWFVSMGALLALAKGK